MYSEGRDFADKLLGRKTLRSTELPQVQTSSEVVEVATVMEHTPTAYRDLLKVVPLVICESYQALRARVRGWTLAQRTYDDLGRHATPDTSSPMDIGQATGTKGKGKKGNGVVTEHVHPQRTAQIWE